MDKPVKKPVRGPKYTPGKQYRCSFAATQFYTVGDLYTCTKMGDRVGFMANDGLFDDAAVMLSRMVPIDG